MNPWLAAMQMTGAAGLIFSSVVVGWRAGVRYWSRNDAH